MTTCQLLYWLYPQLSKHCSMFLAVSSNITATLQASQSDFWNDHRRVNFPSFCPHDSHNNLFYLTTQTCFHLGLILSQNGQWERLKINRCYWTIYYWQFINGGQHADHRLWVLAALLVSQWGDRKARCSSRECSLVLITTSLSPQQTANSLACRFRDNAINQIWTSSSRSHVSFPPSSTRTVILSDKPQLALCFSIWVERG